MENFELSNKQLAGTLNKIFKIQELISIEKI
jgi:hypothetical protein